MSHSTPEEDRITLTPISRPDPAARDNRRRRRTIAVAVLAGVVVVAGVVWAVVAANQGDDKPAKHKAVVPYAFGPYVRSTAAQSAWYPLADGNSDPNKGYAYLSYNAGPDKGAHVSVNLDPPFTQQPGDNSDWLTTIFGTPVTPSKAHKYDAGPVGGTIWCADISANGGAFTECVWNSKSVYVSLTPTLGHHTVTSADAPADLRSFLKALQISEK
ncbi:hypothetical protein [Streptomyces sp. CA-111067]|uniref:hypothetical protein n=1 Tax=Streptomyces sp. CA-111067 TaxID=3240046 RepID=UPI003D99E868